VAKGIEEECASTGTEHKVVNEGERMQTLLLPKPVMKRKRGFSLGAELLLRNIRVRDE
jgi:hypothetical protein